MPGPGVDTSAGRAAKTCVKTSQGKEYEEANGRRHEDREGQYLTFCKSMKIERVDWEEAKTKIRIEEGGFTLLIFTMGRIGCRPLVVSRVARKPCFWLPT